jgi:hypothetical protein
MSDQPIRVEDFLSSGSEAEEDDMIDDANMAFIHEMADAANAGLSTEYFNEKEKGLGRGKADDDLPDFFPTQPSSASSSTTTTTTTTKTTPTFNTAQQKLAAKIDEPLFKEKVKVTPAIAERGRKAIEEKLDSERALERQAIVNRILKYYEFFPNIKEGAPKKGKITVNDTMKLLIAEEERCKRELNSSNAYETIKKMDIFANSIAELICGIFGYNASRLGAISKETQHIVEQELKEFTIKYGDMFSVGPEWRYAIKSLQRIASVIEMNRVGHANPVRGEDELDPAATELLNKKYQNL